MVAKDVVRRFLHAMEHDSPEALKRYMQEHPDADPKNHTVKKPARPTWHGNPQDGYTHSSTGAKLVRVETPAKRKGARPKVRWELHTGDEVHDLGPRATFDHAERITHKGPPRTRHKAARVAVRFAMEFPTPEALESYLKAHPKADRTKHKVKSKEPKDNAGKAEKPANSRALSKIRKLDERLNKTKDDFLRSNLEKAIKEIHDKAGIPFTPRFSPAVVDSLQDVFKAKMSNEDIQHLYGGSKLPKGFEVSKPNIRKSTTSTPSGEVPSVTLIAFLRDNDKGKFMGQMERVYYRDPETDDLVAHQEVLKVDPEYQGTGIGKTIFNEQLETYQKVGVKRVELNAAWVGKYVWSKAEFEWTNKAQIEGLINKGFREYLTDKVGKDAADSIMEHVKTGSDVAHVEVDGKKYGKDYLVNLKESDVQKYGGLDHIEMAQAPDKIKRMP